MKKIALTSIAFLSLALPAFAMTPASPQYLPNPTSFGCADNADFIWFYDTRDLSQPSVADSQGTSCANEGLYLWSALFQTYSSYTLDMIEQNGAQSIDCSALSYSDCVSALMGASEYAGVGSVNLLLAPVSGGSSNFFPILPAASSSLLAAVGDIGGVSSGTVGSVYSWMLIAAGIPLAFYIIEKLIMLIPAPKKKK